MLVSNDCHEKNPEDCKKWMTKKEGDERTWTVKARVVCEGTYNWNG